MAASKTDLDLVTLAAELEGFAGGIPFDLALTAA